MSWFSKFGAIFVMTAFIFGGLQLGADDGNIHVDPITDTPITVDPIQDTPITDDPITNTPITVDPIEVNPE